MISLEGKVALITGASRGIGRATANCLAHLGADIAILDIDEQAAAAVDEIRAMGRKALFIHTDVASHQSVRAAVAAAEAELGPIDILVNNAGIVKNIAPIAKMTPEAWQKELGVNLTGPFNLIQAIAPGMAERGWGRIVNISSAAAKGGLFNQAGYAATKSGLLGLTQNVTLEYAGKGITCNAILPGVIGTENVMAMPGEIFDQAVRMVPTGRVGEPKEVAQLIAFLCSDLAGYINGVDILIDGGAALNTVVLGSRKALRN
ncbi:3-oxoacyl-ACP reductase FabG [uncultured Marinobacter sp.]|uniref:SDR family NAD(P)-dependent oxidoreductase n=1 Tax=uncultured Marinobacter sp. TaxID=187379 RepID=UPI0030D7C36B